MQTHKAVMTHHDVNAHLLLSVQSESGRTNLTACVEQIILTLISRAAHTATYNTDADTELN